MRFPASCCSLPHEARRDTLAEPLSGASPPTRGRSTGSALYEERRAPADGRGVVKTLPRNTILHRRRPPRSGRPAPGSVDCCVTSPPYVNGLRDYGAAGQLGREPTVTEYVENLGRCCGRCGGSLKNPAARSG